MSLTLPFVLLEAAEHPDLRAQTRYLSQSRQMGDIDLDTARLCDEALSEILDRASKGQDGKTARAVESILSARSGKFDKPVPSFKAFQGVLEAYLRQGLMDGWIYVRGNDGMVCPQLVTSLSYKDGRDSRGGKPNPHVIVHTAFYGADFERNAIGIRRVDHVFTPEMVAKRRISDILLDEGILKETPQLKQEYECSLERYTTQIRGAFAQQFLAHGKALSTGYANHRREFVGNGRKVVHDISPADFRPAALSTDSSLHEAEHGVGPVPTHPVVRVFDLRSHDFWWFHADNLKPYVYDKSLGQKLVLPDHHRDLLNVLTQDLDAFSADIVEGKSAGNVILCKGIPGVGKTLTAEVYAELIEKPLYSIHTGSLGTSAQEVQENLQVVFQRSKRWGAVTLLDECDVFTAKRGGDIEQNAIVAEFLRTLEYFDGLMFMTTNREGDIDDAIISRCAAIIGYEPPGAAHAARIWRVMAAQNGMELGDGLVDALVALFPSIAPRDIKMLFRLALRMAKAHNEPLTADVFRRCAMFRAVKMAPETPKEAL